MLTGLSAFTLTPFGGDGVDTAAFAGLVNRAAVSEVDSIAVLGSTGSYAYLNPEERAEVAQIAAQNVGEKPLIVGIGALRTRDVLKNAESAQAAGANALLLAPVSYQVLTNDDVFGLFSDVNAAVSVPVIVYDNPTTTHFTFTDELYASIAALKNVGSIKIPGVPEDPAQAKARIDHLRGILPEDVTLGVSGDMFAATGLNAGCEAWYSSMAATLPDLAVPIVRAAAQGDVEGAVETSQQLQPLWDLNARFGSLRVIAAIAEELDLVSSPCLPLPIRGLQGDDREAVRRAMQKLGLL